MFSSIRRFLQRLSVGLGVFCLISLALAETLVVLKSGNLRSQPSISAEIVAKLNPSMEVESTGQYGEWYQVRLPDGISGWAHAILFASSVPATTKQLVVARDGNLRAAPSTDTTIIGTVSAAMQLDQIDQRDSWYRVRTPEGRIGWIHTVLIAQPPAESAPTPQTVAIHRRGNVRSGAGTGYRVITQLNPGDEVARLDSQTDWIRVRLSTGETGWIHQLLITPPAPLPATIRILKSGNLRAGPGTNFNIIAKLNPDDIVTEIRSEGEWFLVRTADQREGYIHQILTAVPADTDFKPVSDPIPVSSSLYTELANQIDQAETLRQRRQYDEATHQYQAILRQLPQLQNTGSPDPCTRFAVAISQYALAQSINTQEDPVIAEINESLRLVALGSPCNARATYTTQLWSKAITAHAALLSIFSSSHKPIDSLKTILLANPGLFPLAVEAHASRLVALYYTLVKPDYPQALTYLTQTAMIYSALIRNQVLLSPAQTENHFRALMELGIVMVKINRVDDGLNKFGQAYAIAERMKNKEWLDYYEKTVNTILDGIR